MRKNPDSDTLRDELRALILEMTTGLTIETVRQYLDRREKAPEIVTLQEIGRRLATEKPYRGRVEKRPLSQRVTLRLLEKHGVQPLEKPERGDKRVRFHYRWDIVQSKLGLQ